MSPTPNLNLTTPVVGGDTDDWGDELNANFEAIDDKVWKINDPAVWIDVRALGATGANTGNDGAWIQDAVDTVVSGSGGTVFLGGGLTFRTTQKITVPITARNVHIAGRGATLQGAVNDDILAVSDTTTAGNRAEGVTVSGLTINGNGSTDSVTFPNQNGISVGAIINLRLDDVRVTNIPNIGIKGLKSAQAGSEFLNEIVFTNVSVRFTGKQNLSWCETGNVGDDLTMLGCMFNNGGRRLTAAGGPEEAAVFINSFILMWKGMEVSTVQPADGVAGHGYKFGAIVRKAAGEISGIDFENNCNNQAGSADLFLDADCVGLNVSGIRHSCNTATSARTGVMVRSNHVSISGVQHSGGATHTLTNVVDIQGALDVFVDAVGDDASGGSAPSGQYVVYDATTTGTWTDGRGHRISRGPAVSFGGGNIANVAAGVGSSPGAPSITGDDQHGLIEIITGTGSNINQPMVHVTFKNPFQIAPAAVVLTAKNFAAASAQPLATSLTATGFDVYLKAGADSTTYDLWYAVF